MNRIKVFDNLLPDCNDYRDEALSLQFRSYQFETCTFHGIALASITGPVPTFMQTHFKGAEPTLSFFRKSPLGQVEPHFIHTDVDMGDWSALLYLNPDPPDSDGTAFWTHVESGAVGSHIPHLKSEEGKTVDGWKMRELVKAKMNRLVVFPSSYFHSRSIFDNWGGDTEARLTLVTFGRGDII